MEERELVFTKKKRDHVAPSCPCGEVNDPKNPQFAPFEGFDGQYGYCHRCDRKFMPEQKSDNVTYTYSPPPKVPQKFIDQEPVFNWIFPDVVVDPAPTRPMAGEFSITFYFRNISGQLTGAKRMVYNFPEFKRNREKHPLYLYTRESGYYSCLFYERDLALFPAAKIVLVESEKTAVILRYKFKKTLNEYIYLAAGGANGLTVDKAHVLRNRNVIICYDADKTGRESAQEAELKLAGLTASVSVVDAYPDKDDGTDLGDTFEQIDIDFIRNLSAKNSVPQALVDEIREANRKGDKFTDEHIEELCIQYGKSQEQLRDIIKAVFNANKTEYKINEAPLLKRIEHFLSSRFEFKRNVISRGIFYRELKSPDWMSCEYNDVWRLLQHNIKVFGKAKIPIADVRDLLESSYVPKVNPFEEYFNGLPQWDGQDHITALAQHVETTQQDFWLIQFKKCLVRMIACTIGLQENRIVMTLIQQKQDQGKNRFIKFLCPPELLEYYKEDPVSNHKDSELALTKNFIWNLDELDVLNRKEIDSLKAFISRSVSKQREVYARQEVSRPRVVNFWASTNRLEFLTDTQNSRWLCFYIKNIKWDYNNSESGVKNIDITKVWAQAWHLYKTGYNYRLDIDDKKLRDQINHEFEVMPDEKQLIMKYLQPCPENSGEFMVNVDILQYLLAQTGNRIRLTSTGLGKYMSQLDFNVQIRKLNGRTVRGYWVQKEPLMNGHTHPDAHTQSEPVEIIPEDQSLPF